MTLRSGKADLEAVLRAGQSGNAPAPLLTTEQLLDLSEACRSRGLMVHTIEAFAVTPEFEDLRTEHCLFGVHRDEAGRPWPELVESHASAIRELVSAARESGLPLGFQVWIADGL